MSAGRMDESDSELADDEDDLSEDEPCTLATLSARLPAGPARQVVGNAVTEEARALKIAQMTTSTAASIAAIKQHWKVRTSDHLVTPF
jgi:hypothetical protein